MTPKDILTLWDRIFLEVNGLEYPRIAAPKEASMAKRMIKLNVDLERLERAMRMFQESKWGKTRSFGVFAAAAVWPEWIARTHEDDRKVDPFEAAAAMMEKDGEPANNRGAQGGPEAVDGDEGCLQRPEGGCGMGAGPQGLRPGGPSSSDRLGGEGIRLATYQLDPPTGHPHPIGHRSGRGLPD